MQFNTFCVEFEFFGSKASNRRKKVSIGVELHRIGIYAIHNTRMVCLCMCLCVCAWCVCVMHVWCVCVSVCECVCYFIIICNKM